MISRITIFFFYFILFMQATQQKKDLREIFDSFDADKNGTIELRQLAAVAQKLGESMTEDELKEVIENLDIDGDGRISFSEFQYWWQTGKKGRMSMLVYLKAKAMKMHKFIAEQFEKAGINLENHKGREKPDKFDFMVSYGQQKTPQSIHLSMRSYIKGQCYAKQIETIKKLIPQLNPEADKIMVILRLPSKNPAQCKAAIDLMLNDTIKQMNLPIQSMAENPFFSFKSIATEEETIVILESGEQMCPLTTRLTEPADAILNKIGESFYSISETNLTINSSVNEILQNQLIQSLTKGFNFNIYTETNQSALQKLRKFGQRSQIDNPLIKLLTLIRSSKFHLKLKTPEQLQKFVDKLGIKDIVAETPLLKDVLEDISPDFIEAKENRPELKILHKISYFALKHIEDNVDFYGVISNFAVSHLNVSAKNVTKVHQILFNEN